MEKGRIKITEYLYCKCGHPITVIRDPVKSYRPDGFRFVNTAKPDDGRCLWRCPKCNKAIKQNNLVELGAL